MKSFKMPYVRRETFESTEGALRKVSASLDRALSDLEHEKKKRRGVIQYAELLEKDLIKAKATAMEERGRADHFQKRCESFETIITNELRKALQN